ncbi:MAG TPA: lysophospholipid acyltransferase family protein [Chitinivibrionales bacterium]|nr:lysophospholipid acyltransferase family protein [Chitinivibrionales bacterium]
MKRFSHVLEYVGLRTIEIIAGMLPRRVTLWLGGVGGLALYYSGFYRKIVDCNLDHVGLFKESGRPAMVKALYRNMGKYGVELLRIGKKPPAFTVENIELVDSALARGKGVIAVLAHFGNWELLAAMFGSRYKELNVFSGRLHNTLVEKWMHEKRKETNVTLFYAAGALRKMLTVLKQNGILAMLIDQYAGDQGTVVPFLGKPARTYRTMAGMQCKTGCGVVLPYAILQHDGTYHVKIEACPEITVSRDSEDEFIAAAQKAHNDVISGWIMKYPEHYFGWFHRRFKDTISYL